MSCWLPGREPCPRHLSSSVSPTRNFALTLLLDKVRETIKSVGDQIGHDVDHFVVGPAAYTAKRALLRLIPHILPLEEGHETFYRLVLEHDDFGAHNMSVTNDGKVTSVFDWETGHIVPAILSDPRGWVAVDLGVEGNPITTSQTDPFEVEMDETYVRVINTLSFS